MSPRRSWNPVKGPATVTVSATGVLSGKWQPLYNGKKLSVSFKAATLTEAFRYENVQLKVSKDLVFVANFVFNGESGDEWSPRDFRMTVEGEDIEHRVSFWGEGFPDVWAKKNAGYADPPEFAGKPTVQESIPYEDCCVVLPVEDPELYLTLSFGANGVVAVKAQESWSLMTHSTTSSLVIRGADYEGSCSYFDGEDWVAFACDFRQYEALLPIVLPELNYMTVVRFLFVVDPETGKITTDGIQYGGIE